MSFPSANPQALSVQQLQWHTPLPPIPACWKRFMQAFKCDHVELAFKTPDSEKEIYIRESLLFEFLSLAHCVFVCGCGSLCTLWSSQYVQLTPLLHTSRCGFAHRITNYSLHSNSLLPAHNLHKRKMSRCHPQVVIEAETLTLRCRLKDWALKGDFFIC